MQKQAAVYILASQRNGTLYIGRICIQKSSVNHLDPSLRWDDDKVVLG